MVESLIYVSIQFLKFLKQLKKVLFKNFVILIMVISFMASKDQSWFNIAAYPTLNALAKSIETRPAVRAAIQAEGLNETPFSLPDYADPPEGTAI